MRRNNDTEIAQEVAARVPTSPGQVTVTILGAGIAGLTAAHEMIARGFKVKVIERSVDTRPPQKLLDGPLDGLKSVDVGGVARSQWATLPPKKGQGACPLGGLGNYPLVDDSDRFTRDERDGYLPVFFDEKQAIVNRDDVKNWPSKHPVSQLVLLNYEHRRSSPRNTGGSAYAFPFGLESARTRANAVVTLLAAANAPQTKWMRPSIVTVPVDDRVLRANDIPGSDDRSRAYQFPGALLRVHQSNAVVPGEHGFRFFPGFYWHLRDTMSRTPTYDFTVTPPRREQRTTHDNLTEVEWQIMADPTRALPTAFRRKPPSSVEELLEQWQTLRNDLGFRDTDMLRFVLRLARFATSSRVRRRTHYANLSWWDFLSLRHLDDVKVVPPSRRRGFHQTQEGATEQSITSPIDDDFAEEVAQEWTRNTKNRTGWKELEEEFQKLTAQNDEVEVQQAGRLPYGLRFRRALRHSPRSLVAMDAKVTDAYTQGLLATQLSIDQLGLNPRTDSTLNGPSSDAWFRHWRQYLEDEGVEFILGEVTELNVRTGGYCYVDADGTTCNVGEADQKPPNDFHVTICALDPVNTARILHVKGDSSPPPLVVEFQESWADLKKTLKSNHLEGNYKALNESIRDIDPKDIWPRISLKGEDTEFPSQYREWVYDSRREGDCKNESFDPMDIRGEMQIDRRFQVLAGVQLFFERPISFERGHIYFAESPWGLMGLSQVQFWPHWSEQTDPKKARTIRGNLSLVYGCWRAEESSVGDFAIRRLVHQAQRKHPLGRYSPLPEEVRERWPSPGALSQGQLADRTRDQVTWCRGTDAQFRADLHVPPVQYHHFDQYLQFRGTSSKAHWNLAPYLINLRGDWDHRPPGDPWNPNRRDERLSPPADGRGYRVYGDHIPLVFAGAHMRTFTRMATMEAANESARHAVNSLLWHLSMRIEAAEATARAERIIDDLKKGTTAQVPWSSLIDTYNKILSGSRSSEGSRGTGRPVRPLDLPLLETTWFGDFCDIRDHEDYEVPFLHIFRSIDHELFLSGEDRDADKPGRREPREEAYPTDEPRARKEYTRRRRPHLFDLLKLDELPDRVDRGELPNEDAVRAVFAAGKALLQAAKGPDPVKAIMNLIDATDFTRRNPV